MLPLNPYSPPPLLFNAHLETIYPSLFRKVETQPYRRERIETPDDDFLDLDWMENPDSNPGASSQLVIISHGMEGNSHRAYVRGMARAFFNEGVDVLAWNYRGCSEEMNRLVRFYHSGATEDLECVISHALSSGKYTQIFLIGFSLGGNLTLKYLGERGKSIPRQLAKAVTFSVPMDLATGCLKISKRSNWVYTQRFLKSAKRKLRTKAIQHPQINLDGIESIKNLRDLDDRYTAPLHGFADAPHYYAECSAGRYVTNITLPTLIVNAKNDPFLSPECSPVSLLQNHPFVTLETPDRGGHVGWTLFNANGLYWSELRALEFIQP